MANQTVSDLLGAIERIAPLIAGHAAAAEADRHLSAAVFRAMYDAGLYGMLVPKAYGGVELHPADCLRLWEAVARIDAAAAWNLVMNQAIAAYAAWLPSKGVAELFACGIPTIAGALHPPAKAVRGDGGWRLTGQVPFASGCHHTQWLVMPAREEAADAPFGAFFPRQSAKILDTWHTLGMRGTGSADIAVTDLFVPEHLTVPVAPLRDPPPGFEGPLYRMWPWSGIIGEGAISVGVAAAALDAAVHLCKTKTPAYQGTALRDQQLAQFLMGRARARVEASRDTINRAAESAYEDVERSGNPLSTDAKIRLQLAVSFAAEACAEAIRSINDVVGTSSIRIGQPFERHFRDVHTLLQHSDKSSPRYASAGRLMFGLENDWVWLSF
ncbi:MAG TPA: acyl-CoA dehydrogenase family protein [Stellaceae bacterium]|nr:acyl-CoA dehydrogenase family protein [Stellaceae bacterium]